MRLAQSTEPFPHAIREPVTIPPPAAPTEIDAISPRRMFLPTRRSRSTSPAIPERAPVLVHCQVVHPVPAQSRAGTSGVGTSQCAIHSGYPWRANHPVFPICERQKFGPV